MSKTAEALYELCLQVSTSRGYEVETEEIQDIVLDGDKIRFEGTGTDWSLFQCKNENNDFWFTFVPDYSGILHSDDLLSLMAMIREFEEVYTG